MMKIKDESATSGGGTQSLERAICLLRAVARHAPHGARLTDLMLSAGLPKPTAHRLLTALTREGLVEYDPNGRHYHPGPDLEALGRIAAGRHRPPVAADTAAQPSAFLRPEYQGDAIPLASLLCDRHARTNGARAALLHESVAGQTTELNFARLAHDSARLATVLAGLGVAKGDCVAVLLPKGPELLITALAIWRLGGVYMPLFTNYTQAAILFRLNDIDARVVVTNGFLHHQVREEAPVRKDGRRDRPVVLVEGGGVLEETPGTVFFWSALHAAAAMETITPYAEGDAFAQIYTPGTETRPYGLSVPVKALAGIEQNMRVGVDLRDDDIYWNMADPGWAYGIYYGLIGPLLLGRTTIFCDGPYNMQQGRRMLTKFGITNLTAAPSQMRVWHSIDPGPDQLALRVISVVGEPLPYELVEWTTRILKVPLLDQYGQRETGIIIVNRYDPGGALSPDEGSLGRPMPGYRIVVLDPDGHEAPVGGAGEIAIDIEASPLFWFESYTNDPERTARRFRHGRRYYLTGDWAFLDAEGNIHYRGRVSDAVLMQQSE